MSEAMHIPACLCGKARYRTVLRGSYSSPAASRDFEVARCEWCGLVRTLPPPYEDELEADIYQDYSHREPFENQVLWRSFFAPLIAAAKHHKGRGRFLDVGCGSGFMVRMALEAGFDACGLEINQNAARYARECQGLNVMDKDLGSVAFPEQYFDVVSLSQVLEHIAQPEPLLAEIRRILKHDGVLLVEVPNIDGLVVPLWGRRWSGFQPQWHLWHFSSVTVTALLKRYGFEVIDINCRQNIHVAMPASPLKKLVRRTVYRLLERLAELVGRADKVLVVARAE